MTDWDKVYRENYESRAFWDIHWFQKAKDLIASAKLIEPQLIKFWDSYHMHCKDKSVKVLPDYYQGTYFMLLAFAVENIFKAAIIGKNPSKYRKKFQETLEFPKSLKSHNLINLAKKAGFVFGIEEEDLLSRLTRSAIWYGRYPIPLDYKDTSGAKKFSDNEEYSVSWFGANDVERLNKFIEDLKSKLNHYNF